MNSCFVSNAAAIAKRKLEQKPKPDKKPAQANPTKQHASEQKATAMPQKQVGGVSEINVETLRVLKRRIITDSFS